MLEPFYAGLRAPELAQRRPIHVVLDNIRSALNVGSIFRTADAAGVTHIYLCGLTAWPPHSKLEKTSLGAHEYVPWTRCEDTTEALACLRLQQVPIMGLETSEDAVSMRGFAWPTPVAVVFGHEVVGILPETQARCDGLVRIPVAGHKKSLNVATAFGIVTYDILRTWEETCS